MTSAIGNVEEKKKSCDLKINENFVYVRCCFFIIPAWKIYLKVFNDFLVTKIISFKIERIAYFLIIPKRFSNPHKFDNRPWDNLPSKAKSAKTHL